MELRHKRSQTRSSKIWLVLIIFLHLKMDFHMDLAEAAHILGIFPYLHTAGPLFVTPLVRVLVERGHRVTVISPENSPTDIEGVRHLRVPALNRQIRKIMDSDNYMHHFSSKWAKSILAASMLANISTALLTDEGVQKMMKDSSERFDMVMIEASHLEAMYGLAEYYNATLMGIASMRLNWHVDDLAGNPSPSIQDSISLDGPSLKYSLLGRFYNWLDTTEEFLLERLVIRPAQLDIFERFFGYSAEKLEELRSRFALILINTHFSMGRVRANVPNIIEVGGMHLSDTPEPCDEEMQRFLDEAEHGVIYFSMGLEIRFKYLPDYMQQPLLQRFSELKQKVVWKNELFTTPNKTDNVYRIVRAPQRIILSHPNTRLFITHGGLLSVIEAINGGVPMLGLPLFFDQFNNMQRVEAAGMAKVLDWNTLSVDTLIDTVHDIIEQPKYVQKAREMAHNFRDRPMNPLDTAVWWTEYALRHRNASHMRLNKGELPFMAYYQLDNLLPLLLRIGMILMAVIFLGYKLLEKQRFRQRRQQERNLLMMQQIIFR